MPKRQWNWILHPIPSAEAFLSQENTFKLEHSKDENSLWNTAEISQKIGIKVKQNPIHQSNKSENLPSFHYLQICNSTPPPHYTIKYLLKFLFLYKCQRNIIATKYDGSKGAL